MKITIESTTRIVQLMAANSSEPILCRVWEGHTESGVKVECLIPRISANEDGQDLTQFNLELIEHRAPSEDIRAFPLRMII